MPNGCLQAVKEKAKEGLEYVGLRPCSSLLILAGFVGGYVATVFLYPYRDDDSVDDVLLPTASITVGMCAAIATKSCIDTVTGEANHVERFREERRRREDLRASLLEEGQQEQHGQLEVAVEDVGHTNEQRARSPSAVEREQQRRGSVGVVSLQEPLLDQTESARAR